MDDQLQFDDLDAALDYFDEQYTKQGKPLPYSSLFNIVADKIDKEEIRIQPKLRST